MLLNRNSIRSVGALGLLMVAASSAFAGALAPQKASADSRMTPAQGQRLLAARSARFVENKGQWDPQAKFLARTGNLDLWFTNQGIRYDNYGLANKPGQTVDMTFVGGGKALPMGRNKLRARIDFVKPGGNATNVGAYGELVTRGVLPGVDMRSYFDGGKPRYDLIVAPGSDPSRIKLAFKGDNGLSIANGTLRIATRLMGFSQGKPVAYQQIGGKRIPVAASWKLSGKHMATFALGTYDRSKTLVIDPLIFGTYFGGNDNADEVRAVVADPDKNVYFTGSTRSARFPVLSPGFPTPNDPQGLNINVATGGGASDVFVSRVAGDAYSYDYSAFIGGSVDDVGQFIKFDPAGNVWVAGTTASSDFPLNDRGNVQFLSSTGQDAPFAAVRTNATFRLDFQGLTTAELPFNATPNEVLVALRNTLGNANVRSVRAVNGGTLPNDTYRIELAPNLPFAITVQDTYARTGNAITTRGLSTTFDSFGIQGTAPAGLFTSQEVRQFGSDRVNAGNYSLNYTDLQATPTTQTTTAIQPFAQPAAIQTVLNALTNHANETAVVDLNESTPTAFPGTFLYSIHFNTTATPPVLNTPQNRITVNNGNLRRKCAYTTRPVTDAFVLHLLKNADGTLTPSATNSVLIFGSDESDELTGFDIWQRSTFVSSSDPVEFVLSGSTSSKLLNYAKAFPGGSVGFLARYTWSPSTGFETVFINSNGANAVDPTNDLPYVTSHSGFAVDVTGVAIDSDGSAYIGGTLNAGGNFTTSPTSTAFFTTNGIFTNGNQVRNQDVFVRKYERFGNVAYSGVIGGHGDDQAGGTAFGLEGSRVNTGSSVALDQFNNLYITGVSRSFDFPRTRGVFGEVFSDTANIFVTKVDATGSTLLYSTNLQDELGDTIQGVPTAMPAGIAVDSRGYAYITGNLRPSGVSFPTGTPGDPNQPTGSTYPTISLANAADATYTGPTGSDFPTTEPFLTVLNPTATGLALSTYLGGALDDFVYAPSISPYGDVFAVGWTDSLRRYQRVSSTGVPTVFQDNATFPLITNLAIKQVGDQSGGGFTALLGYGFWGNNPGGIFTPTFVSANYSRDGFITEFRVDAASVSNLTFAPTSIPGGLGAFTTGTVTLSQGAPSGGGQIVISLPNGTTNATLSNTNPDQDTLTIAVAEGATTATFQVFSKAVPVNTSVSVRATFAGTFKQTAFQVVPWLQRLQLSNDTMIGGDPNLLRGTITLAAPAPAGGVEVSLASSPNKARVVNVPFTVPAGQTSAPFDIESDGVDANTAITVTASLLGVDKTAPLTLTPATLQSVTVSPDTVAGGSSSTAIVTLNGKAGDLPYVVTLTSSDPSVTLSPTTVTIAPQTLSSATTPVTITTSPVAVSKSVTITAHHDASTGHPAATRTAVLQVQALTIASITLDPTTVESGGVSQGTVTLATSAPAGGAKVYLSATVSAFATMKSSTGTALPSDSTGTFVLVPAGSKTATFQVQAGYVGALTTVGIVAQQGAGQPQTATLSIKALVYTLALDPTSTLGSSTNAQTVTGTVTIPSPAVETLTFAVTTSNGTVFPNGTFDTSVTIPVGSTTGTFTLHPQGVTTTTSVVITVTFGAEAKTATLSVRPVGILSLVPRQKVVRSGSGQVNLTAFFEADTAVAGELVLSTNLPSAFGGVFVKQTSGPFKGLYTKTYQVPAGISSLALFPALSVSRVSRSQDVTFTATYNGTAAATVVTVSR